MTFFKRPPITDSLRLKASRQTSPHLLLRSPRRFLDGCIVESRGCFVCRHAVPNVGLSKQVPRPCTVWFDLPSNFLNEVPHVVRFVSVLPSPDSLQDLPVQQDLARITREIRQHFKLASC